MPRPSRRTLLGVGIPIAVIALLLAAWGIDTGRAGGKVPRNVRLAGRDVGRLSEDRLTAAVQQVARGFATTPVEIRTTEHTYKTTAGEAGLTVDEPRTVAAALDLNHDDSLPLRPLTWVASFASPRHSPVFYKYRADQLALVLIALEGVDGRMPTEPSIVGTPDSVGISGGQSGYALDATAVGKLLVSAAETGRTPISVRTEPVEQKPAISDDDARTLANELAFKTGRPFTVTAGADSTDIPVATVRSWLKSEPDGTKLKATIDKDKVLKDIKALFTSSGATEVRDASITLVDGVPTITPSQDTTECCAPNTPDVVLDAIVTGKGRAELPLVGKKADFTTEDAEKLGIKEPVGGTTEWKGQAQVKSFTTYYAAGEPRVTNIHRIADIIRGTIVKPGETFSVNGKVGKRTIANGFVVAGAIANGEHVNEVGGGVSQFATTMFNAAFFDGLPFGEYQSHSEHFDRYPYGREATMGYEHPDLQWKNDTPYGIMIWTSYTATSVTVTLYSTQYASAEQTGQTTSHSGNCTSVSTQRTITYADGHTKVDTVRARYRDAGATKC